MRFNTWHNLSLSLSLSSTKYGIYKPNCGLNEVLLSFGHDEYLYQVLVGNGCTLPEEALYMIRYHSFYPWHVGRDYDYLCNEKDLAMMKWVQEFKWVVVAMVLLWGCYGVAICTQWAFD